MSLHCSKSPAYADFALTSSVCVITILRIVFAVQFNYGDFTHDYVKISLTTALEPLLGIIVASLPMFPPIFREQLRVESKQDFQQRHSASTVQLRSPVTKPPLAFTILGDSYSLEALSVDVSEKEMVVSNQASLGIENGNDSKA